MLGDDSSQARAAVASKAMMMNDEVDDTDRVAQRMPLGKITIVFLVLVCMRMINIHFLSQTCHSLLALSRQRGERAF